MATSTSAPTTIYLVAIDESTSATRVLEVACNLGASLGGPAELHIVHVIGLIPAPSSMVTGMAPMELSPALNELGRSVLDRACAEAGERFREKIVGHLRCGDPWHEIVNLAAGLDADLVVVGTAGRMGLARALLGSVAEQVVRHAGCPVLVARPKDYHASAEPGIEPPCVACVKVQKETARAVLWCDRHATHHPHGRLHYELPPSFAVGSMNFRP